MINQPICTTFKNKEEKEQARVRIWHISPHGYIHAKAMEDVAIALDAGFKELGLNSEIIYSFSGATGKIIILGANLLVKIATKEQIMNLPKDIILYNLEVIQEGSSWINNEYLELLKQFEVWDYSQQNIKNLEQMGISNIKFCGIGYEDSLTKIPQLSEDKKDIDVLFYGSMNERRKKVLDQLRANGLNVVVLFGKYGSERDEYIARSKIIINIHYYEAKVFEIVRTSYLLANKCFVVSEEGNDSNLEEPFVQGIAFSSYTQLVDTCMKYLKDKTAREKIAKKGFEIITSKKQSDYLKALI